MSFYFKIIFRWNAYWLLIQLIRSTRRSDISLLNGVWVHAWWRRMVRNIKWISQVFKFTLIPSLASSPSASIRIFNLCFFSGQWTDSECVGGSRETWNGVVISIELMGTDLETARAKRILERSAVFLLVTSWMHLKAEQIATTTRNW